MNAAHGTGTGLLRLLSAKLNRAFHQLPLVPRVASLVWTSARHLTLVWALLLLVQGLLPVVVVYLTRTVVNSVLAAIRAGGTAESLRPALLSGALMAVVLLASEALRGLESWIRAAQSERVRNHISQLVHEKSASIDLAFYETPDFFDHLHRARAEASQAPLALIENLAGLVQNGITLLAMAGVLSMFGLWLPAALLAGTIPALYVVLHYAARHHEWWVRTTPDERRAADYDWVLTSQPYAAELRLFGLASYFQSHYRALRDRLSRERIALARGQSVAEFAAGSIALAITGMSLLWMASRAVHGKATAGDLALFYQAFQQGMRLMRVLLDNVGHIYRNSLYLEGLFQFLDLEPVIQNRPQPLHVPDPLRQGVCFRNVCFRYPGSSRYALDNFSLEAPAGSIVAILGENGAGKSTLIKLLCRFYDPESGCIELDGCNLRDVDLEELRQRVTVLFQEPVRYHATVAQNVSFEEGVALPAIEQAARSAGADEIIAKLPLGYRNPLGKWIDEGAELSGGEWQRIALARAFLRAAPIMVLDEPTSAMDPWAEADWLDRFRKLAAGRTALLITHRFTTARVADRIAVMSEGRVVEYGTHDELLVRGSRYAAGWTAQATR